MNHISYLLIAIFLLFPACQTATTSDSNHAARFPYTMEKTESCIAVYGTANVSREQFNRACNDIRHVLNTTHPAIVRGLLNSNAKMLVVGNEDELEQDIAFFLSLLPVEAVFVDNEEIDETLPNSTRAGISTTKLELMYLIVYYALLADPNLSEIYQELQDAYDEATRANLFSPGEAYRDGYIDDIHLNASEKNALKYGSYLIGLYTLYFGNDEVPPGEFTLTTRVQLQDHNPNGHAFMRKYLDD